MTAQLQGKVAIITGQLAASGWPPPSTSAEKEDPKEVGWQALAATAEVASPNRKGDDH
jgi:hypothetical protein